jgi:hypothetical protein
MGTTLTGTTPQDTYDSLIKVTDNGPLSATAKYLSDGLGNDSVLALSTNLVGVGKIAAARKLEVQQVLGGNAAAVGLFDGGATLSSVVGFEAVTSDLQVAATAGIRFYSGSTIGNVVTEPTNERMRITSAGLVGIGTSAPAKNLEVSASTDATLRLNSASTAVTSSDILGAVEFFANDSSADGTGIAASINASPDNAFGQGGMLRFNTRLTNAANAIERMRITNEGYVRLATGGIQFNGDTAAANALDDYEEGTWTPVIRGSSTAGTYELGTAVAAYTKIGRQVTVTAQIVTAGSVTGGGSGYAQITGLPFNNANQAVGAVYVSSVDFSGSYLTVAFISSSGQNTIYFVETNDNAGATDLPISAVGGTRGFNFTLTYFV